MRTVDSIEQIRHLVSVVRAKRNGFITNFYLDPDKHTLWIDKGILFYLSIGDTIFLIKKNERFSNLFYCSTTVESLSSDMDGLRGQIADSTLIIDIVGKESQCLPIAQMLQEKGFSVGTSLVRMTRKNEPVVYEKDESVRVAKLEDIPLVNATLHRHFDERLEQLPFVEELESYAKDGGIFISEDEEKMIGFLIFEKCVSTMYLRYWFTDPLYRGRRIGARLMRRFFEEGRDTTRQILWVMRDNENAIVCYKHYGFEEEALIDYVMIDK